MNLAKTQFRRIVELDRQIRGKKYPNCLTFADYAEVSQKTAQRDIDYLRDQLEAPIEYDRLKKGYYYTQENWFLPAMNMSEGDLLALLIGARALEAYHGTPVSKDLGRIFSRIAELLPDKLTVRPELIFDKFSFVSPPAKPIEEGIWTELVRGLTNQRTVKISYRSFEAGESKDRVIDPYHMANLSGEWYVFARCHKSDQLIQFAVPRIQKAELLGESFKVPADFDPAKYLATTFGRYAMGEKVYDIRLLFDKEVAAWVLERQWHQNQKIIKRSNGDIELSFKVGGLFEVFRWVMAWGHCCRVLAPAELKNWVRDEVKLMVKT